MKLTQYTKTIEIDDKGVRKTTRKIKKEIPLLLTKGVELKGHTRYFICPLCGFVKSEEDMMFLPSVIVEYQTINSDEKHQIELPDSFNTKKVEDMLWCICSYCNKETTYIELEKNERGEYEMTEEKEVNIGPTGVVELEEIDVEQYIGKEVRIENVTEHKGEYGYFIKVQTEVVDTLKSGKELKASRVFGLMQGKEGKIGWTESSKLGLYLKKMNANHYKDLVGKVVKIQTQLGKDGKNYMTF